MKSSGDTILIDNELEQGLNVACNTLEDEENLDSGVRSIVEHPKKKENAAVAAKEDEECGTAVEDDVVESEFGNAIVNKEEFIGVEVLVGIMSE